MVDNCFCFSGVSFFFFSFSTLDTSAYHLLAFKIFSDIYSSHLTEETLY
jgi:hypothetical protein